MRNNPGMQLLSRVPGSPGLIACCVLVAPLVAAFGSAPAAAADELCRVVEVDVTPSAELQMVAWVEDEAGNYVDTIFITRLTGTYGLGNRPGMMEFNTSWRWPYGRRTTTFPVWANRHGGEFPLVVFQNNQDDNLSHPLNDSSVEAFYCRPFREGESGWDMQTCASTAYTDKGVLSPTQKSKYPPRVDHDMVDGIDDPSVAMYRANNPFDAVSRATPPGGVAHTISWAIPDGLADGNYVVWVEVAKELDQNASYQYPEPTGIPWSEYGIAYRGQPSVLYTVPFAIGQTESVASSLDYVGYGDPDGLDGNVRSPDATISTTPGSGAGRLLLSVDGGETFRVRAAVRPTVDEVLPGTPSMLDVIDVSQTTALVSFAEGGDDGELGPVTGYEVVYRVGGAVTEENFASAMPVAGVLTPVGPGNIQSIELSGLLPSTNYWVGVRAFDECLNFGPVATIQVLTPDRESGSVDACFVATAAYGSLLANDVSMLRRFRDIYLRSNVTGELFVEAYYTFGPAFAGVVGESDLLRRAARAALLPVVRLVGATIIE